MVIMNIYYNGDQPYHVVRTLPASAFDPRKYGINRTDEQAFMMILQLWRDDHHCDHVLRKGDDFMLCRTITEAVIDDSKINFGR